MANNGLGLSVFHLNSRRKEVKEVKLAWSARGNFQLLLRCEASMGAGCEDASKRLWCN